MDGSAITISMPGARASVPCPYFTFSKDDQVWPGQIEHWLQGAVGYALNNGLIGSESERLLPYNGWPVPWLSTVIQNTTNFPSKLLVRLLESSVVVATERAFVIHREHQGGRYIGQSYDYLVPDEVRIIVVRPYMGVVRDRAILALRAARYDSRDTWDLNMVHWNDLVQAAGLSVQKQYDSLFTFLENAEHLLLPIYGPPGTVSEFSERLNVTQYADEAAQRRRLELLVAHARECMSRYAQRLEARGKGPADMDVDHLVAHPAQPKRGVTFGGASGSQGGGGSANATTTNKRAGGPAFGGTNPGKKPRPGIVPMAGMHGPNAAQTCADVLAANKGVLRPFMKDQLPQWVKGMLNAEHLCYDCFQPVHMGARCDASPAARASAHEYFVRITKPNRQAATAAALAKQRAQPPDAPPAVPPPVPDPANAGRGRGNGRGGRGNGRGDGRGDGRGRAPGRGGQGRNSLGQLYNRPR